MRVILAEKPSVAKDIALALGAKKTPDGFFEGNGFLVAFARGHLFEIDDSIAPEKWTRDTLPILPQEFLYRPRKGVSDLIKNLKQVLRGAEEIVIATDPGREGELIARLILKELGWKNWKQTKRLWTAEALTPDVVRREMARLKPANEFDSLYWAALARQHADWIVGINLTRAVSLISQSGGVWSVGRVQTPTLKLIVERERAIQEFKPQPYGVAWAIFTSGSYSYKGRWLYEGKDLPSLERARHATEKALQEGKGLVEKVDRQEKTVYPPLLHSLSSLQREANKRYGFSAKKTLDIAQKLYEEYKVISYPRTDSRHMPDSPEAKSLVKKVLQKLGREDLLSGVDKAGKRVFDSTKLTDHHAIIPLAPAPKELSQDELRVYTLVAQRFFAVFSSPYRYLATRVLTRSGGELWETRFKEVIEAGWTSEEKPAPEKSEKEEEEAEGNFPLSEETTVKVSSAHWEEKKTEPPARYTEGSLIKEMERLNLGTPATRAAIIETLKTRNYVFLQGKVLKPAPKGVELVELLKDQPVSSPEMTGEWERELDSIWKEKREKRGYEAFMSRIVEFLVREVQVVLDADAKIGLMSQASPKALRFAKELAKKRGEKIDFEDRESVSSYIEKAKNEPIGTCSCGQPILPFSKGWACQGGHKVWEELFGKKLTAKQALALLSGEEILLKGAKGKSGKPFDAYFKYDFPQGKTVLDRFAPRDFSKRR